MFEDKRQTLNKHAADFILALIGITTDENISSYIVLLVKCSGDSVTQFIWYTVTCCAVHPRWMCLENDWVAISL